MVEGLVGVSILLPCIAGLLCFLIKSPGTRSAIIVTTGAILTISALMLFNIGPCTYTPHTILGIDVNLLSP